MNLREFVSALHEGLAHVELFESMTLYDIIWAHGRLESLDTGSTCPWREHLLVLKEMLLRFFGFGRRFELLLNLANNLHHLDLSGWIHHYLILLHLVVLLCDELL